MTIPQLLTSDSGLTLVGAAVGAVWTAFRSTSLYQRMQQRRHQKALLALEAGVDQTYRTYVQALKQARADGKLTPEEAAEARQRARAAAIEFGRTQGVDVLREVGEQFIDLAIAKLVKRIKGA